MLVGPASTVNCAGELWRPAHIQVQKVALMVRNCLPNDGCKHLPVDIAVTIRAAQWLDPHVLAVNHTSKESTENIWCVARSAN